MDVSTIITLSRKQTSATVGQIPDADYLKYLNITYKEIFSILWTNSKKYTWNTFTTNIVANQNEYVLPQPDVNKTGMSLVLDCYVKWEKIPIFDTAINTELNTETAQTFWIIRDWSIFLYPTPEEDAIWWLVMEWKYIPLDLALNTTSDEIKLAPQYHNILIQWLNALVFWEKQIFDKQQLWEWKYRESIRMMQTEWAMENESGYPVKDPDLSQFE